MHVSLHLEDAAHGLGLQLHHAVLHPVVQVQVISSSQGSGMGGNNKSWRTSEFLSILHLMVSERGRTSAASGPAFTLKPDS